MWAGGLVSLDKLRRELAKLREGHGLANDCPGCGYPSYSNVEYEVVITVRRVGEPHKPRPPNLCKVCGREEKVYTIKVRGLEKAYPRD
jgi:hypothetical protein